MLSHSTVGEIKKENPEENQSLVSIESKKPKPSESKISGRLLSQSLWQSYKKKTASSGIPVDTQEKAETELGNTRANQNVIKHTTSDNSKKLREPLISQKIQDLTLEDIEYLTKNSRLALRHVTTQSLFLKNMCEGIDQGDAIPLFNWKGDPNEFSKLIKDFIRRSIISFDTGLFLYFPKDKVGCKEVELIAQEIMLQMDGDKFNRIYFMVISNPALSALEEPSVNYPLGKCGIFSANPEKLIRGLFLNSKDRKLLIKSKNSIELREQLVDIFYKKFCAFVKNMRQRYELGKCKPQRIRKEKTENTTLSQASPSALPTQVTSETKETNSEISKIEKINSKPKELGNLENQNESEYKKLLDDTNNNLDKTIEPLPQKNLDKKNKDSFQDNNPPSPIPQHLQPNEHDNITHNSESQQPIFMNFIKRHWKKILSGGRIGTEGIRAAYEWLLDKIKDIRGIKPVVDTSHIVYRPKNQDSFSNNFTQEVTQDLEKRKQSTLANQTPNNNDLRPAAPLQKTTKIRYGCCFSIFSSFSKNNSVPATRIDEVEKVIVDQISHKR